MEPTGQNSPGPWILHRGMHLGFERPKAPGHGSRGHLDLCVANLGPVWSPFVSCSGSVRLLFGAPQSLGLGSEAAASDGRTLSPNQAPLSSHPGAKYVAQGSSLRPMCMPTLRSAPPRHFDIDADEFPESEYPSEKGFYSERYKHLSKDSQ